MLYLVLFGLRPRCLTSMWTQIDFTVQEKCTIFDLYCYYFQFGEFLEGYLFSSYFDCCSESRTYILAIEQQSNTVGVYAQQMVLDKEGTEKKDRRISRAVRLAQPKKTFIGGVLFCWPENKSCICRQINTTSFQRV